MYGNVYLARQGIDYESTWDLWSNLVALGGITLCLMVLTYIRLRLLNKYT